MTGDAPCRACQERTASPVGCTRSTGGALMDYANCPVSARLYTSLLEMMSDSEHSTQRSMKPSMLMEYRSSTRMGTRETAREGARLSCGE